MIADARPTEFACGEAPLCPMLMVINKIQRHYLVILNEVKNDRVRPLMIKCAAISLGYSKTVSRTRININATKG